MGQYAPILFTYEFYRRIWDIKAIFETVWEWVGHEVCSRDSARKSGNTDKCSYSINGAPNHAQVMQIGVTGDVEYDGNIQIGIN